MTTTTTPSFEIPEIAFKVRDQFLGGVKQYQQFSLEATQNWFKTLKALPTFVEPTLVDAPVLPSVDTITAFQFDLATELLSAQRAFTNQLAQLLVAAQPAKNR
jgi:hypothetical protein